MNPIKRLRLQHRMTQKQLSAALDVGYSTVAHWEQGHREPSSTQRRKLAKYFNVSEADLIYTITVDNSLKEPSPSYATGTPVYRWISICKLPPRKSPDLVVGTIYTNLKGDNYMAVAVQDAITEFQAGDYVVIDLGAMPRDNDYVIVAHGQTAEIMQFKQYGDKIILRALREQTRDIDTSAGMPRIVGRIVQKIKNYG